MNLATINISRGGDGLWRVWLPHSCSPDEPIGDDLDQVEWGDFYFITFDEALDFVRPYLAV